MIERDEHGHVTRVLIEVNSEVEAFGLECAFLSVNINPGVSATGQENYYRYYVKLALDMTREAYRGEIATRKELRNYGWDRYIEMLASYQSILIKDQGKCPDKFACVADNSDSWYTALRYLWAFRRRRFWRTSICSS